jgi:uncharacterized protein (DUF1501 family)
MKRPIRPASRRDFLLGAGALLPAGLLATRLAFAGGAPVAGDARASGDGRFVFILMRGALDGLAAVPPVGDPDYARLRGPMAVAGTALDGMFALHPAMQFLAGRFASRELLVMHAIATPYRDRSHFDGQDLLESGATVPHALQSGWLNRALAARGQGGRGTQGSRGAGAPPEAPGVALGANVPLVMRGPAEVSSWSPSRLASLREETLQRLADLYAGDATLSARLADALASDAVATEAIADEAAGDASMSGNTQARGRAPKAGAALGETLRAAAGFLRAPDGARVAVLETTGWDTHANEGGSEGALAQRLGALDAALGGFRDALGPAWDRTAVLLATEFGRTAASNGTRGTDHGTGAAAFLVGGAVAGGRVLADWPGLSTGALYQGRDLAPTRDLRAVFKGVLHDHLQVGDASLDAEVFPGSAGLRREQGLLRG